MLSDHLVKNVCKFECTHTHNTYTLVEGWLSAPFYRALSGPCYRALSGPFYRALSEPFYRAFSVPLYMTLSVPFYMALSGPLYSAYFMCVLTFLFVLNFFFQCFTIVTFYRSHYARPSKRLWWWTRRLSIVFVPATWISYIVHPIIPSLFNI